MSAPHFVFFFAPFCVRVGSPQGQGQLREPATPAGRGLFAGCPRATHPTARLGRQMGRWPLRWVARGASSVCPERCERGLGFPALVQGLSSGRCAPRRPRRPLASPCPREQSQERQGAAADSPAVDCLVVGKARLVVSPWAGPTIPSNWAHDCGIHRSERPAKWGIGDNLYAASVTGWYVQVETTEGDVRCDSGSRLLADACHLRTGRATVAVLMQASAAGTALRGEREGQAEFA